MWVETSVTVCRRHRNIGHVQLLNYWALPNLWLGWLYRTQFITGTMRQMESYGQSPPELISSQELFHKMLGTEEGMTFVQIWGSFSVYLSPGVSKSLFSICLLQEVQAPEDQLTVTCTETGDQVLNFLLLWNSIIDRYNFDHLVNGQSKTYK